MGRRLLLTKFSNTSPFTLPSIMHAYSIPPVVITPIALIHFSPTLVAFSSLAVQEFFSSPDVFLRLFGTFTSFTV